ncbi:MAG: PAS domain S-box protein, partial [Polyangiales bacterium]
MLWPFVRPSVWFLFYPAVFLSSWIGGLRAASISAVMCALFALWFFLPPQHSFLKPVGEYFAASIFITTGVVFGVFHGRLRRANLRTQSLLAASQRANEELEKAVKERQLFAALIDNSSDFIGIADPSGKPVYVNPAGRRMVGLSADQSIEETKIAEYYTPDQRAFAEDVIVRSMIENGHWQGETAFRHWQTQEAIPVSDTHFTIRDPNTAETLGFGTVTRDISEMKQARDELERARVQTEKANAAIRAAHADLERAQSVAKLGSWRLDVRHDVLAWSDENYRIFGVPLGTPMTYEGFLACVHPDDRALIDREWKAALRGEPYDIEHRIVANGATKWVREKADLEFDEHHALVGGIGITQDVTERRKYEHELQEERERVELALRGADLGAWDWNIESGEAVFSPRWAEMRGRRPDELRGTLDTWLSGIHPEDLPRVQKILDDYLEGRTAEYEAEMRVRTQSGQWIWILDRGKVITRDPRGKPIRMVGTELDITARRRAEEELRLAEAKASGIVALSADAIITIDEAQRITLYNEGAEKIFGYSRAEAIGTPLELLIPERFRAKHRLSVQRFIAGQEAARRMIGETRALRKNGEEFPTDSSISKLEVAGRKILTVSLRDITEQKRVAREHRLLAEVGALFASTLEYEETVSTIARLAARDLSDFCIVDVAVAGDVPRQIVESRDPEDAWICGLLHALMLDRSRQFLTRGAFETRKPVLLEHLSPDMVSSFAQSEEHLRALQALDPKSVILVPLLVHGEMLGALALVSSTESRVYGPSDVRLAEELALRAALAIANARLYRVAQRAIKA